MLQLSPGTGLSLTAITSGYGRGGTKHSRFVRADLLCDTTPDPNGLQLDGRTQATLRELGEESSTHPSPPCRLSPLPCAATADVGQTSSSEEAAVVAFSLEFLHLSGVFTRMRAAQSKISEPLVVAEACRSEASQGRGTEVAERLWRVLPAGSGALAALPQTPNR